MNQFTQLAKMICQVEGKKKQLDIAQVKEVLKIITDLKNYHMFEILKIVRALKEEKFRNAAIKQKALAKNKNKRKK